MQATTGTGYVDVSWQPPSGGGPVASYTVSVSPSGGTQTTTPPATSVHVTRLTCGTTYSFTVYSVGAGGQKVAAAPVSAQSCKTPTAPQGLSPQVSQHQIQLSWSPPAAPGGGTVTYTVDWGSGPQTASGTSYTITGLANFSTYNVTVTASSQAGTGGSQSASVSVSPGRTWGYNVASWVTDPLRLRTGPSTSDGIITTYYNPGGMAVGVICQTWGSGYKDPSGTPNFGSPAVWDKLTSGGYMADGYITTPNASSNQFSPSIWQCS